jgi:hypothetical protein
MEEMKPKTPFYFTSSPEDFKGPSGRRISRFHPAGSQRFHLAKSPRFPPVRHPRFPPVRLPQFPIGTNLPTETAPIFPVLRKWALILAKNPHQLEEISTFLGKIGKKIPQPLAIRQKFARIQSVGMKPRRNGILAHFVGFQPTSPKSPQKPAAVNGLQTCQ